MILFLDSETTTKNKGNPFTKSNQVVCVQLKYLNQPEECIFYDDPSFKTTVQSALDSCTMLVGHNLKFDLHWLSICQFTLPRKIRCWDTMLAEFILSNQTNGFSSLDSLSKLYGGGGKTSVVSEYWAKGIDTLDIPREILEEYGNNDVKETELVYQAQQSDSRMTEKKHKLIILDGLDLLVLQKMEFNGLKYDKDGSRAKAEELQHTVTGIEAELAQFSEHPINLDSGDELSCFLYGGIIESIVTEPHTSIIKTGPNVGKERTINKYVRTDSCTYPGFFKPVKGTELAKSTSDRPLYQTSEPVLLSLSARNKTQKKIIELLLQRAALVKLIGTYLEALPQLLDDMEWGDYIHCNFNQTVARTGRLSSSKPNMQNNPEDCYLHFVSRYE